MTFINPNRTEALLIEIYNIGWEAQMKGEEAQQYSNPLWGKAYSLGFVDAYTAKMSDGKVDPKPSKENIINRINN